MFKNAHSKGCLLAASFSICIHIMALIEGNAKLILLPPMKLVTRIKQSKWILFAMLLGNNPKTYSSYTNEYL